MSFIEGELAKRRLPALTDRAAMLDLLREGMYGLTPPAPAEVLSQVTKEEKGEYAGKADMRRVKLEFDTGHGVFSFPVDIVLPRAVKKPPVFLHLAFRPEMPDKYLPVEEIIDGGFGIVNLYYCEIVNDGYFGDFTDGMGRLFFGTRARKGGDWGKIGMWAYAASRAMDYIMAQSDMDGAHVAVIGHSRLGKTALWCGAQDERFFCTISNDSGAGGAAITRDKKGEHIRDFVKNGLWDWFCEDMKRFADDEDAMPFDQHMLLACISPRLLCVGSAREDEWADPDSEYLACAAASKAYEDAGVPGLIAPDRYPSSGDAFPEGNIGYHLRAGSHFLSREDWRRYMAFMRLHMDEAVG